MTAIMSATSRFLRKAAIAAIGCSMSFSVVATGYVATILPSLGGSQTVPNGIDNSGAVTGESSTGAARHAFLWKNGSITDLGVISLGQSIESWGFKANPAGQVTGSLSGGPVPYAFVYADGVMTPIAPGNGFGINAAGDVVGESGGRAFLYQAGVMKDLGTMGYGAAVARAINNAGTVTGYVHGASGEAVKGFIWKDGVETIIESLPIALDINDAGEVLGLASVPSSPNAQHVFVWKNGVMTDTGITAPPGTIPASGYSINNAGHVMTPEGVYSSGVFTTVENMLPPELAPGLHDGYIWIFPTLSAMNDAGQVTGWILRLDASTYATTKVGFVLTPGSICSN